MPTGAPLRTLASLVSGLALAGCSVFGVRSGYEEPPYEVLDTLAPELEVRRYGVRLAAEATGRGDSPEDARGDAFRVLAGYIFGDNRSQQSIEMTVPVEVDAEPGSEKIAMTVPVETAEVEGGVTMRFFLPAKWTRETLPEPTSERVRIVEVPGETLATLRFSGLGGEASLTARRAELLDALGDSPWSAEGEPITFFYDPPWTLPFLRRNEVAVPVARPGPTAGPGSAEG